MFARIALQMLFLGICVIVLCLAAFLEVASQDTGQVMLGQWTLPELCQSKRVFQVNCPGCGLTRSFIYMAHGDVPAAFRIHAVGAMMFVGVIVAIPFFILNTIWLACGRASLIGERGVSWLVLGSTLVMMTHWLFRLLVG